MSLLPFHIAFMCLAFLCMVVGISAVRFFKSKKWWFKTHKALNTTAACSVVLGLACAVIMVQLSGESDAGILHRMFGALTALGAAAVAVLGYAIFKAKGKEAILARKRIHRYSGRVEAFLMPTAMVIGFFLIGLL